MLFQHLLQSLLDCRWAHNVCTLLGIPRLRASGSPWRTDVRLTSVSINYSDFSFGGWMLFRHLLQSLLDCRWAHNVCTLLGIPRLRDSGSSWHTDVHLTSVSINYSDFSLAGWIAGVCGGPGWYTCRCKANFEATYTRHLHWQCY